VTNPLNGESMAAHPAAELIAAYLSGTLSPPEVAAVEGHVAGCRACRQEVTSARRLIRSRPRPNRWWLALPAAAAAAVIIMVGRASGPRAAPDAIRADGGGPAAAGLTALAPADRQAVPLRRLVFVWASHAGRPVYHLTLMDGAGRAVWLGETPDTTLALPAGVSLDAGQAYYWYVDALDVDGGSLTTGTHRFTAAP